jgi:uncharacterized protein
VSVKRFDSGSLRKPKRLSTGFLRADAFLTKTGVFVYRNPDGTERRELRLPEEVFRADSLQSFETAPLTDDHPSEMLTSDNAAAHVKGAVSEVRADGSLVRGTVTVYDSALITKMSAGKVEVSCGYECDLDHSPGTWRGQRYDAIQRNIRGNHVAIVDAGRAGSDVRVRMDSADAVCVGSADGETKRMTVKIDGIEIELEETAGKLVQSKLSELEKQTARADAAEASLSQERAARKDAEDPAKIDARVNARVALVSEARKHLGADARLDGMSDRDVRAAVVEKLQPGAKLEGKSEDYVTARFDAAIESVGARSVDAALVAANAVATQGARTDGYDESTARAKAAEAARNRWKEPAAGAAVAK